MTTNFNRVLFDYDGTILIHDKENEAYEIGKVLGFDAEQILIFESQLKNFFGHFSELFKGKIMTYEYYLYIANQIMPCLKKFGKSSEEFDEAVSIKTSTKSYLSYGIFDALEYLKDKGYKLCIFTNGFYNLQVRSMKCHKVFDYFEEIYAWDNFYPKPDLRFMKRALKGTNPKENVMIGDNLESDIQMANRAGVFSIGYKTKDDLQIKPKIRIENMSELKNIL